MPWPGHGMTNRGFACRHAGLPRGCSSKVRWWNGAWQCRSGRSSGSCAHRWPDDRAGRPRQSSRYSPGISTSPPSGDRPCGVDRRARPGCGHLAPPAPKSRRPVTGASPLARRGGRFATYSRPRACHINRADQALLRRLAKLIPASPRPSSESVAGSGTLVLPTAVSS